MSKIVLQHNSEELHINVISVHRRCTQFVVNDNLTIDMFVPIGMTSEMTQEYVELYANQITHAYDEKKMRNHQSLPIVLEAENGQVQYRNGLRLPFFGEMNLYLRVKFIEGMDCAKCYVEKREDGGRNLIIKTDRDDQEFLRYCIIQFYTKWSKKIALKKAKEYGKKLKLSYTKLMVTGELMENPRQPIILAKNLSLKNQATIWGQCNWKKELKFDWKLAMLPMEVIEYVIVHEMIHLKKLNHSKGFWAAVEQVMPEYAECRNWMNNHGHEYEMF